MAVTKENKGKPFELSSEYEIKTLISKICANVDCHHTGSYVRKSGGLEQKSLIQKSWLCHFLAVCVSGRITISEP